MSQEVIDHVNQLGKANCMPEQLKFYNQDEDPIKSIKEPAPEPKIAEVLVPQHIIPPPQPGISTDPAVATLLDPLLKAMTSDLAHESISSPLAPDDVIPGDPEPAPSVEASPPEEEAATQDIYEAPVENTTEVDPPELQ